MHEVVIDLNAVRNATETIVLTSILVTIALFIVAVKQPYGKKAD